MENEGVEALTRFCEIDGGSTSGKAQERVKYGLIVNNAFRRNDTASREACGKSAVELELDTFLESDHQVLQGSAESFEDFVSCLVKHNPLQFWSNPMIQHKYPTLFKANLVALAYACSSAFSESWFSTSGFTLRKERSRLWDNPEMVEATVMLKKVHERLIREGKEERQQAKEEDGKKKKMKVDTNE